MKNLNKKKKVLVVIITYNDQDYILNVIKRVPKDLNMNQFI